MPAIGTLKSSRTREKRALLKEEIEAQRILQTELGEHPTEIGHHLLTIGKILLNLETKLSRLEAANEKLIEAFEQNNDVEGAEQFQQTLDEESEVIDGVIDKLSQLKVLKAELERRRREGERRSSESIETRVTEMQEQVRQIHTQQTTSTSLQSFGPLKPPQLEIAPFNGDILKWQEFWDAFEASVHQASYAPVDKLNYLKSKLQGEALAAISGYQLSNENYAVVVDVLKKRFGNQQLIIDAHYRHLSHIPPASNQVSKLRQCYDAIERHLRCLEAVGERVDHRHFVALILEKLPQKVRCHLYMQKSEDEQWTVPSLRQLLGKYICALEMAGSDNPDDQTATNNSTRLPSRNRPTYPRSTTEGLFVTTNNAQIHCVYCNKSHWSDQCPTYVTLQARKEKLRGCCYNCLKKGHTLKDCLKDRPCAHCGKRKSHHRSLCQKLFEQQPTSKQTIESQNVSTIDEAGSALMASSRHILMQTATVMVKDLHGKLSAKIRLILDSGSQRSYVTESLAKQLKLPLDTTERLSVVTFASDKPKQLECKSSKVQLSLKDGKTMTLKITVVPNITGKIHRVPLRMEDIEFLNKELGHSMLADPLPNHTESSTIDMLIGNDYYFDLLEPQKLDLGDGVFLFNSKLGWVLGGQIENTATDKSTVSSLIASTVAAIPLETRETNEIFGNIDLSLMHKPNLEQFWNLESIGITDSPRMLDDDKALESFDNTVMYEDNRYFVAWPWREPRSMLPENYNLAKARLKSTLYKLQKDDQLLQTYATVIQEQVERGIIEKVTDESVGGLLKHYIPHHAVVTPTKTTTKVRVVYDASAKTRQTNKSLNECLYRGPVMLPDLSGLLLRFRLPQIAVVGDIEKAFLSIGLQKVDRDVTRFLWLKDPTNTNLENNVQVYRFCRVPFGVISSPFLLSATIKYHLQKINSQFAKLIQRDMYMDNMITGARTFEEAKLLYTDAKNIFATASMNLREWASNSQQFMGFIPHEDKASNVSGLYKILGINWNILTDEFSISKPFIHKLQHVSTKREVLQAVASIFDPLGYFSPTILEAKVFIRELWAHKCNWDDQIDDKQQQEWLRISRNLESIPQHQISRCIGIREEKNSGNVEYSLICFCDASVKAYATAIYLRQSTLNSYKTDLIFAKTRLAPQDVTIPRLELLGVLIGVRALKFVMKELYEQVTRMVVFTDSLCVLHWLTTRKPLSSFVVNRLKEIMACEGVAFKHIPSDQNPADWATRGKPPSELTSMWWNGPSWLNEPDKQWPDGKTPALDINHQQLFEGEIRGNKILFEAKLISGETPSKEVQIRKNLSDIEIKRFSSLHKLLRVTAWLLRFVDKLLKRDITTGPITASELQLARLLWEQQTQHDYYSDIIHSVKGGKRNNVQHQLNLHLDTDGVKED